MAELSGLSSPDGAGSHAVPIKLNCDLLQRMRGRAGVIMKEGRYRVLVVDDEQANLLLLDTILRGTCDVLTAGTANAALDILKTDVPDLILLDVMMPGVSGFDLCRILKEDELYRDIPVIFITAMADGESEMLGLQLGAVDYIAKPFLIGHVRKRVQIHLELKHRNELLKEQRAALEQRTLELEDALRRIKRLEGLIPICMYCKKIRNTEEIWQNLEEYLVAHSDASFTHGMCPACLDSHMKGLHEMFEGKSSTLCEQC